MFKGILIIVFVLSFLQGNSQDKTQQLYNKCIGNILTEIKPNENDTLSIIVEGGFIDIPGIAKANFKLADADFFNKLTSDATFRLLKVMPIKIIKDDLVIGIGYYNFKQQKKEREMVWIANYYFHFKFSCNGKGFLLYKTEKESV